MMVCAATMISVKESCSVVEEGVAPWGTTSGVAKVSQKLSTVPSLPTKTACKNCLQKLPAKTLYKNSIKGLYKNSLQIFSCALTTGVYFVAFFVSILRGVDRIPEFEGVEIKLSNFD